MPIARSPLEALRRMTTRTVLGPALALKTRGIAHAYLNNEVPAAKPLCPAYYEITHACRHGSQFLLTCELGHIRVFFRLIDPHGEHVCPASGRMVFEDFTDTPFDLAFLDDKLDLLANDRSPSSLVRCHV